ncbi:MAG: penicillin-binding transpeptidase domain-containing protein [Tatlockia sp.]|jgi:cell division protein FtsI (penicillin-binding protein 3)
MKNGHPIRLAVVSLFFLAVLGALLWRMIDLTVLHRQFYQGQGDARSLRVIDIPAHRGMITDKEGYPLAVSTPVESVWINPKTFAPTKAQLATLCGLLNLSARQLTQSVQRASAREFLYLQRQLPPPLARQVDALQIPGINFQQEFKRYYPEGDSTAHLIGFTNIDDQGIEGLELAYQDWLMGMNGKKRVVKDRYGQVVEELGTLKSPRRGNNLVLSIDRRIQYLAFHELQNTMEKFAAKSGSVVVLDTQTGEILAAANAPSFNPNARGRYTLDSYRNRALTDTFEPGSVIKPFAIASALGSGLFRPSTIIDTRPSWMIVHGHTIRDGHNYGVLNVTGVLEHSSNVGVAKMVLASPPEQLIGFLQRAGFGQRTESGYPGESDGSIVNAKDANPFVLGTLSFGYGMAVTALQLAKGYLLFANKGRLIPVTLLHTGTPLVGEQVLHEKTANEVLAMLESVTNEGTGRSARVPGYRIAGKTGTAQIAGKNGYEKNRHIASFVGIAPASNPRLVIAVVIHEPTKNGYYAASVAAPLFAQVMSGALRILDVLPDQSTA